jgi:hypothetical protein
MCLINPDFQPNNDKKHIIKDTSIICKNNEEINSVKYTNITVSGIDCHTLKNISIILLNNQSYCVQNYIDIHNGLQVCLTNNHNLNYLNQKDNENIIKKNDDNLNENIENEEKINKEEKESKPNKKKEKKKEKNIITFMDKLFNKFL